MKRLSRYDRVQALIRNPKYLKDFREITQRGFNYEKETAFLKKYGIGFKLDPEVWRKLPPDAIEGAAIFEDDWAVKVVYPEESKLIPVTDPKKKRKCKLQNQTNMGSRNCFSGMMTSSISNRGNSSR